MCHAVCILCRSEDGDLVVRCSESLDTFKCLLPIVQAWCHTMYAEVGVFDEFGFRPLTGLDAVAGFDVAINCTGS